MQFTLNQTINLPQDIAGIVHSARPQLAAAIQRQLTADETRHVVHALLVFAESLAQAQLTIQQLHQERNDLIDQLEQHARQARSIVNALKTSTVPK